MKTDTRLDTTSVLAGIGMAAIASFIVNHAPTIMFHATPPVGAGSATTAGLRSPHWAHVVPIVILLSGAVLCLIFPRRHRDGAGFSDLEVFQAFQSKAYPHLRYAEVEIPAWTDRLIAQDSGRQAISEVLANQLTDRFRTWQSEEPHRKALLALLMIATHRDTPDGQKRYELRRTRLSKLWSDECDPAIKAAKAASFAQVLDEPELQDDVEMLRHRHAFSETVLMAALADARKKGPLPESDFGWLWQVDRPLAMALNSVGRPSVHFEAIGAWTHYEAESESRERLTSKRIEDGVSTVLANYRA